MRLGHTKLAEDFSGQRVLIIAGEFAGTEGFCVGKSYDDATWAISPDESDRILQLRFESEFGLVVDLSGNPQRN